MNLLSVLVTGCFLSQVSQPAPPAASAGSTATSSAIGGEVVLYSTRGDSRIHVLSAVDLSHGGSFELGVGAHELICSADGRWVLGTAYGGPGPGHQPADHRIAVFDLASKSLHRTIDLSPLSRPNDGAFIADGVHTFITVEAPARILKLNAETGAFTQIELDRKANHMLALSPDGSRLYVSHVMPGGLTVIDTATDTIVSHLDLPAGAEGLAVTMDNSRVWIACNRSDLITIVDPVAGVVEREIPCEGFPLRLRACPIGTYMAASCPKSGDVALFEVSNPDRVRRVSMADTRRGEESPSPVPTSIAFTGDGKRLAVVCGGSSPEVVLVDVESGTVVARRPSDGPIADALTITKRRSPSR